MTLKDTLQHRNFQSLRSDPDVEHCFTVHYNDRENINPFFFLGFVYLLNYLRLRKNEQTN